MSRDNSPGKGMRKRNQSFLETHRRPRKHSHAKHKRRTKINENTRTAHALQLDEFKRTESREPNERTKKVAINTILSSLSRSSVVSTQD